MNANARDSLQLLNSADHRAIGQRIEQRKQEIGKIIETLETMLYKPEGKAWLAGLKAKRQADVSAFSRIPARIDAGQQAEAARIMDKKAVPARKALPVAADKPIHFQGQTLEASAGEQGRGFCAGQSSASIRHSRRVTNILLHNDTAPSSSKTSYAHTVC